MIKYNSNENSDSESLICDKKCFNMLLNTYNNLYDWYIDSEAFIYIINH